MAMHEVTERLYYTRDKSRVVKEGDPEAAFLFATPGTSVPMEEAERVGLTGKKVAAPEPQVVHSVAADPAPADDKPKASAKADAAEADAPEAKATRKTDVEDKAVEGPRARDRDR